jgi:hypothetical protein
MSFLVALPASQYPADAFGGFAPGAFNLPTARAAMWAAQLAYEEEEEKIERIAQQWQLKVLATFEPLAETILPTSRTRGLVLAGHGAHTIAFAGTDPLVVANWVTDLDFPVNSDGIHQGFDAALEAAWGQIKNTLSQIDHIETLLIVGHSLGGALAVLAGQRLLSELSLKVDAIYTFGMPRAGDREFAAEFDGALGERTYRLVHGDDIVPTVPPSELGFLHVGRFLACQRFDKFNAELLTAFPSDDPSFACELLSSTKEGFLQFFSLVSVPAIRPDLIGRASSLLPPGIADHLPDRYCRALDPT